MTPGRAVRLAPSSWRSLAKALPLALLLGGLMPPALAGCPGHTLTVRDAEHPGIRRDLRLGAPGLRVGFLQPGARLGQSVALNIDLFEPRLGGFFKGGLRVA